MKDDLEARVKALAEMYRQLAALYDQDALLMWRAGFKEEVEKYRDLANRNRLFSEQLLTILSGEE